MNNQGVLLKDFKRFVTMHSERIKQNARAMAENSGRPYIHLNGELRKQEKARKIADSDGIIQGLVCILAALEACQSFKLALGKQRPRLVSVRRKCLCLYFYFIDPEFVFMHVRIPTWFPFTIQIYINAHGWLAHKLDQYDIGYNKLEEDVMTFLGRKLYGCFQGEVVNHYKKRWLGARVKHRMKQNGIKMYDKHDSVL